MSDSTVTEFDDVVEVSVPLRAEFGSTLRVLVAASGADAGLNIDDIDDLRLAVSEVFTILTDLEGSGRCITRLRIEPAKVSVTMGRGVPDDPIELDALASTILSSVVDGHEIVDGAVVLTKRSSTPS